jgi:hypothetical protein
MIADEPVLPGAVKLRVSVPLPTVIVTPVGALGGALPVPPPVPPPVEPPALLPELPLEPPPPPHAAVSVATISARAKPRKTELKDIVM